MSAEGGVGRSWWFLKRCRASVWGRNNSGILVSRRACRKKEAEVVLLDLEKRSYAHKLWEIFSDPGQKRLTYMSSSGQGPATQKTEEGGGKTSRKDLDDRRGKIFAKGGRKKKRQNP